MPSSFSASTSISHTCFSHAFTNSRSNPISPKPCSTIFNFHLILQICMFPKNKFNFRWKIDSRVNIFVCDRLYSIYIRQFSFFYVTSKTCKKSLIFWATFFLGLFKKKKNHRQKCGRK